MEEYKKKAKQEYTKFGFVGVDKALHHLYVKLPIFTYAEFCLYTYLLGLTQSSHHGGKLDRSLDGYCYRTKTRISNDLGMSKAKLNRTIDNLIACDLLQVREAKNKRGGHFITQFKCLPPLNESLFYAKFGDSIQSDDSDE